MSEHPTFDFANTPPPMRGKRKDTVPSIYNRTDEFIRTLRDIRALPEKEDNRESA